MSAPAAQAHGRCEPRFEAARVAFAAHLGQEAAAGAGASFAVWRGGRLVLDLWGGWADARDRLLWREDTLVNVWSATKSLAALAVARLVERGTLDYAAPIARWWPAFAAQGKEAITLEELMSHQAGLPGLAEPALTLEDFYAHEPYVDAFAAAAPLWRVGEGVAYHAMSFGHLLDAAARRADGRSLARIIREELFAPDDRGAFVGAPALDEPRVARMIVDPEIPAARAELARRHPAAAAAMANPSIAPDLPNDRAWRAAEIPAGNGHATARALAESHGRALDGALVSPPVLEAARAERVDGPSRFFAERLRFGAGFMLNQPDRVLGPGESAFGHVGWGGATVFADPQAGVAIAYAPSRMLHEPAARARRDPLLAAVYAAL